MARWVFCGACSAISVCEKYSGRGFIGTSVPLAGEPCPLCGEPKLRSITQARIAREIRRTGNREWLQRFRRFDPAGARRFNLHEDVSAENQTEKG